MPADATPMAASPMAATPAASAGAVEVVMSANGVAILVPGGVHTIELPAAIRLRVGDAISVTNDDSLAHVVLGRLVASGATDRRIVERVGLEVYGAGCAVHGGGAGLTTLIVSAR
jgi:plastocyanin